LSLIQTLKEEAHRFPNPIIPFVAGVWTVLIGLWIMLPWDVFLGRTTNTPLGTNPEWITGLIFVLIGLPTMYAGWKNYYNALRICVMNTFILWLTMWFIFVFTAWQALLTLITALIWVTCGYLYIMLKLQHQNLR